MTTPALGYPIPVTIASFTLTRLVFGLVPWAFHLGNVLLHLLACALAFKLALRLGLRAAAASGGVALFALHPVVAEPASWITGRKDLLAAVFLLLALLAALGARPQPDSPQPERRRSFRRDGAALALFALGMLAKPVVAASFPLCAFAPELLGERPWPRRTAGPRALLTALAPALGYVLVAGPIVLVGLYGQGAVGATRDAYLGLSRAHTAWYALAHHASLLLLWEEPTVKYAPRPWPPVGVALVDVAPLLLVPAALASLRLLRGPERSLQRRAARFGLAACVLGYLPSASLLVPLSRPGCCFRRSAFSPTNCCGRTRALASRTSRASAASGQTASRECAVPSQACSPPTPASLSTATSCS